MAQDAAPVIIAADKGDETKPLWVERSQTAGLIEG